MHSRSLLTIGYRPSYTYNAGNVAWGMDTEGGRDVSISITLACPVSDNGELDSKRSSSSRPAKSPTAPSSWQTFNREKGRGRRGAGERGWERRGGGQGNRGDGEEDVEGEMGGEGRGWGGWGGGGSV